MQQCVILGWVKRRQFGLLTAVRPGIWVRAALAALLRLAVKP
jgi:hypothetical protein